MTIPLLPGDPHDDALRHQVHPPAWTNPMPASRYDLVVVGAGPAGLVCAAGAAGLGARVALVECDLMGGDCLNVGCVPSKAVLRAARAASAVRRAPDFGILTRDEPIVQFPVLMERMRRLRAELAATDSATRFQSLGVDVFLGEGRFVAPDALEVAGQTLRFRKAVLTTGARPRIPEVPGLLQAGFLTNENIFTLTTLPPRLAVVGAGPIGSELAQAFARFGSRVTLIHQGPRPLPRDDSEAGRRLLAIFQREGIETVMSSRLVSVESNGEEKVLHLKSETGERRVPADAILLGVGRQPNVETLGLEAAGVRFDRDRGVEVNDHLRTTNRRIYAAGDVCSRLQFTHAADAQARLVLQNALFRGRARASSLTIPWCTYTDPEVAGVGLTEEAARAQGVSVQVFTQELRSVDRAVLDGESEGFVKILVRAGTDRIVGATVLSTHAGEMIGLLSLALSAGVGLRGLTRVILPYPTQAEAVKKIADAWNRTRLTPRVRWLLRTWLKWGW
jgi:pyruvate/2-oxoglutarate dehydrogenase complex dihydrolipoamide dehydrogenase (E3) component